jgi:hypothetical protein
MNFQLTLKKLQFLYFIGTLTFRLLKRATISKNKKFFREEELFFFFFGGWLGGRPEKSAEAGFEPKVIGSGDPGSNPWSGTFLVENFFFLGSTRRCWE